MGLDGLRSSSTSGEKHPKQPISTAKNSYHNTQPQQQQQEEEEEAKRMGQGTASERREELLLVVLLSKKRLVLMHEQTGHGTATLGPQEKLQIRSRIDHQPARRDCGVRRQQPEGFGETGQGIIATGASSSSCPPPPLSGLVPMPNRTTLAAQQQRSNLGRH